MLLAVFPVLDQGGFDEPDAVPTPGSHGQLFRKRR